MTQACDEPAYDFRAVTSADMPLLAAWLAEPHVAQWWTGGVEASLEEIRQAMDDFQRGRFGQIPAAERSLREAVPIH